MKILILVIVAVLVFSFVFLIDLQKPKELESCEGSICSLFNNFLKVQSQFYEYSTNHFSIESLKTKEKLLDDAGLNK